jgi:hypothetical protein
MSQISKQALIVDNSQSFPNNNVGDITPSDLRSFNVNMIDSLVNEIPYQSFTASVTNSINLLNQFSASQQPSFTNLNAFTASQLVLNTGYNAATYSLDARLDSAEINLSNLNTWSQSVNEIKDDGILQGYSTRLHFYGLVSASIVPNVNGAIASIDILQDGSKVGTGSYNAFTSSTNQRIDSLEVFSGSAKISIAALNAFTASVGPIQTGSLVNTASYSGTTITYTKGDGSSFTNVGIQNTASFNSYTSSINSYTSSTNGRLNNLEAASASVNISVAELNTFTSSQNTKNTTLQALTASLLSYTSSNDIKWGVLGSQSGSWALINASNTFSGSQTITGSVYGNVTSLSTVSATASMDLSKGNFFTLTLSAPVTTIQATNIKAGQTANLLITQNVSGTGSIVMASTFKQQSGNFYTTTISSSAQDLLSFVAFDTSSLYLANVKNLI